MIDGFQPALPAVPAEIGHPDDRAIRGPVGGVGRAMAARHDSPANASRVAAGTVPIWDGRQGEISKTGIQIRSKPQMGALILLKRG